jgi:hypothetical protein
MATIPGKTAFILAAVLVVAAFVTINTWAVAKHEDGWRALSATGTIYRSSHLAHVY